MSNRYDLADSLYEDAINAFHEAIAYLGGQTPTAEICGCTQGNISQLLKAGSLPSPTHARKLADATGIPASRIRPDIYPDPTSSVLPGSEVVEGGAPIVPGDRRAKMQCVKS
ncbi:helix-turn-helix domain-containing protein [Sphingomonas sanguinis]|nr:helix-turn-helix domain-containing protein [Sphingomonas sanguinis]